MDVADRSLTLAWGALLAASRRRGVPHKGPDPPSKVLETEGGLRFTRAMPQLPQPPAPPPAKPVGITFAEFLRSTSPQTSEETVSDVTEAGYNNQLALHTPDLRLHCPKCDGIRVFHCANKDVYPLREEWKFGFLHYRCRNCDGSSKIYAVAVRAAANDHSGLCYKYGELPTFGDPLPPRIWTLVGDDKELFLQGRRSELRGLGIGALTYYRRVVENQWERIVGEIVKVAQRVGAKPETITQLNSVAKHTQFARAVDAVKPAVPEVLLIGDANPLTLLHSALSDAIHDRSDKECLELAKDIRTVLVDLADRIAQALKDEAELKGAVSRLQTRLSRKAEAAAPPPKDPSKG